MTVSITWSLTNGGAAVGEPVNLGSVGAGSTATAQQLFISHDGVSSITGCRLYLAEYSGSYTGGATAAADYSEIVSWGDEAAEADFGGLQINMDTQGGFASSWPTYGDKTPSHGKSQHVRTGVADTFSNGVILITDMNAWMLSPGVIPASMTTWPSFQIRSITPTNEGTSGARQFDLRLRFTYTS